MKRSGTIFTSVPYEQHFIPPFFSRLPLSRKATKTIEKDFATIMRLISMGQTSCDSSHLDISESLSKVEKVEKMGVLEAKISENFAIFTSLLKMM